MLKTTHKKQIKENITIAIKMFQAKIHNDEVTNQEETQINEEKFRTRTEQIYAAIGELITKTLTKGILE